MGLFSAIKEPRFINKNFKPQSQPLPPPVICRALWAAAGLHAGAPEAQMSTRRYLRQTHADPTGSAVHAPSWDNALALASPPLALSRASSNGAVSWEIRQWPYPLSGREDGRGGQTDVEGFLECPLKAPPTEMTAGQGCLVMTAIPEDSLTVNRCAPEPREVWALGS